MKNLNFTSQFILLTLLLITGCQETQSQFGVDNTPVTSPPTSTHVAEAVPSPLKPILPTATEHCLTVENEVPPEVNLSGRLILYDYDKGYNTLLLPDYTQGDLPENTSLIAVSPDGRKIILRSANNEFQPPTDLWIANSAGEISRSIPWENDWAHMFPIRWLDNNTISIHTWQDGSIVALKLDTGERQLISFPQADEVLHDYYDPMKGNYDFVEYSPVLDMVIYRTWSNIFIIRANGSFGWTVIWAKGYADDFAQPIWSVDGSMVAVPVQDDNAVEFQGRIDDFYSGIENVYLYDHGDKRLTNFREMYNEPFRVSVANIVWSPDSSRFALKLAVKKKAQDSFDYIDYQIAGRLLVVVPATDQVIDYCLLFSHSPVWSPDGKFIAIDKVIVDLERQRAYKITEDSIVGWMVEDNK